MNDIGPFTKGLMFLVLGVGCVVLFLTPYIGVYCTWTDLRNNRHPSENSFVGAIIFGGWSVIQTAMILDWIYWWWVK